MNILKRWWNNLFPQKETTEHTIEINTIKEFAPIEDLAESDGEKYFIGFCEVMRKHRGKLTDMDDKLRAIYESDSVFALWMSETKILGINKAYEYTQTLLPSQLAFLVDWIKESGVRNVKKIDEKVKTLLAK